MAKRYIIFRNYLGSVEPNCKKAQLAVTSHQKWLRNPPYYMPHLQDVLIMTWEHSFDGGDTKCSLEPTFCSILFWFYQIPTLVSNKDSVNTWLLNVTHFCVILLKIKLEKERKRERERERERERVCLHNCFTIGRPQVQILMSLSFLSTSTFSANYIATTCFHTISFPCELIT